jgi:acetyltransferase-like isoleucine patch superfamily enzyme
MVPMLGEDSRAKRLAWRVRALEQRLRVRGLTVGRGTRISRGARIANRPRGRIVLGRGCEIHAGAILASYGGTIQLGERCSVNPYTILYGHGGLRIGNDVRIAAGCVVIPENHRIDDPTRTIAEQGRVQQGIVIEDDVWIGAHVTVLDGVTIGRGAVIAAGAVVTKDVPPLSVAAGVPARVVRSRERVAGG